MLDVQSLDHYYGGSHTLRDVSLLATSGACTVLMGRNGVGKTTLLKCIMGLLQPRQGSLSLDGRDLLSLSAEQRALAGIGYVPQGRQIFPLLTVEENLCTGLAARKDGQRKVPEAIRSLFPILADMRHRRGGDLSGGQQQQLAIARALVTDPTLLVLDEPTEGIQPSIVDEIGDIIGRLNREMSLTVLLVEQKLAFARRVGDRFAIMDRGTIVASGGIESLDDELVRDYLTV